MPTQRKKLPTHANRVSASVNYGQANKLIKDILTKMNTTLPLITPVKSERVHLKKLTQDITNIDCVLDNISESIFPIIKSSDTDYCSKRILNSDRIPSSAPNIYEVFTTPPRKNRRSTS